MRFAQRESPNDY
jgi:hypothetical protein